MNMKTQNYRYLLCMAVALLAACSDAGKDVYKRQCTNYDEKMRKFDASFTKMRKITSANVLNHELILGRPYIIHYADSSVVIRCV